MQELQGENAALRREHETLERRAVHRLVLRLPH
jgi:hypothetical protein